MIDFRYEKKCNPADLSGELIEAGFLIHGISTYLEDGKDITIVHLKDTETKDPTSTVEAHVYIPPDQKTAVRILRTITAGMPEWISSLKIIAEALGVNINSIPEPDLKQTPKEILKDWITLEMLHLKEFNAMLKALGESELKTHFSPTSVCTSDKPLMTEAERQRLLQKIKGSQT